MGLKFNTEKSKHAMLGIVVVPSIGIAFLIGYTCWEIEWG